MTATAPTRTSRANQAQPTPVETGRAVTAAIAAGAGVAVLISWLAFEGGAYGVMPRTTLAIVLWFVVLAGVACGFLPLARVGVPALVTGGLLAAFVAWTGLSMTWASSAERAFLELDRAALLLGVFALAVLLGTRANSIGWADGLAVAIAGVGLVALASRLFPESFPEPATFGVLQPDASRLDWPVDYANGLAILIALGLPFLLRAASAPRHLALQALAVAPIPALAATVYLTSSRGGTATVIIAAVAYLALTSERANTIAALLAAAVGSAGTVAVLLDRNELVNRPLEEAAVSQGRSAAPLVLGLCLGATLLFVGLRLLLGLLSDRGRVVAGGAAALLAAVAVVAVLVAVDPIERFDSFRQPPEAAPVDAEDPNRAHLLSLNGAGRWQYWTAAAEQFEEHRIVGQGAGSYEAWWAQHGEVAMFIRDAHSLYLETLGELGLVGFLLLGGALGTGVVLLVRRALRASGADQALVAAFGAAYVAFLAGAGVDWMWELTVVPVVGMLCLGLLVGPATAAPAEEARPLRPRVRIAARVAIAAAAFVLVVLQGTLIVSEALLRDSRAATARGDDAEAIEHARQAWAIQPWSASAPLQVALVTEAAGYLETAQAWIEEAAERDPENWRIWLVRSRIETNQGRVADARRSLARARALNPRSVLFATPES